MKNSVNLTDNIEDKLSHRCHSHQFRTRMIRNGAKGTHVKVDENEYLSFCSNDYLGLATHPAVIKAFKQGLEKYGASSCSSQLVTGHSAAHQALEEALADFFGCERVLVFSNGYMANLASISTFLGAGDAVFHDRENHASLLDASLLSKARLNRYRHLDLAHLKRQLEESQHKQKLIVTEGVFSMSGDIAPLKELIQLARAYKTSLMLDDAHGVGCLGKNGCGTLDYFNINMNNIDLLSGTFSKAFGTYGAFVAGSETLVEALIQFARTYIFTTALPPALAEATLESLRIIRKETWRREYLTHLINRFKRFSNELDIEVSASKTHIQPILIKSDKHALDICEALRNRGILVYAARPPTVPTGTTRLRINLSAAHTEKQIRYCLESLHGVKA